MFVVIVHGFLFKIQVSQTELIGHLIVQIMLCFNESGVGDDQAILLVAFFTWWFPGDGSYIPIPTEFCLTNQIEIFGGDPTRASPTERIGTRRGSRSNIWPIPAFNKSKYSIFLGVGNLLLSFSSCNNNLTDKDETVRSFALLLSQRRS